MIRVIAAPVCDQRLIFLLYQTERSLCNRVHRAIMMSDRTQIYRFNIPQNTAILSDARAKWLQQQSDTCWECLHNQVPSSQWRLWINLQNSVSCFGCELWDTATRPTSHVIFPLETLVTPCLLSFDCFIKNDFKRVLCRLMCPKYFSWTCVRYILIADVLLAITYLKPCSRYAVLALSYDYPSFFKNLCKDTYEGMQVQ